MSRIDRRANRTRNLLQNALFSLIPEKAYETITVADICDKADVGRSTFYAHYTSKDDLKRSGIDDRLGKLLRDHQSDARSGPGGRERERFAFSLLMFEHARDHRDLYRALAGGRGGAIAFSTIRQIISDLVRKDLAAADTEAAAGDVPLEAVVQYVTGAYMALLTWWLDRGATPPPEQMDTMFRRLTAEGVRPLQARR